MSSSAVLALHTNILIGAYDSSSLFSSATQNSDREYVDTSVFGLGDKEGLSGMRSSVLSCEGFRKGDLASYQAAVARILATDSSAYLCYCPEGSAFGNDAVLMKVHENSLDISSPVKGAVMFNLAFTDTGGSRLGKLLYSHWTAAETQVAEVQTLTATAATGNATWNGVTIIPGQSAGTVQTNMRAAGGDYANVTITGSVPAISAGTPLANPTAAPTAVSNNGGSSLSPSGTYLVAYSYFSGQGETLVSPTATVVVGSSEGINVTLPALPVGAYGYGVYLSSAGGNSTTLRRHLSTSLTSVRLVGTYSASNPTASGTNTTGNTGGANVLTGASVSSSSGTTNNSNALDGNLATQADFSGASYIVYDLGTAKSIAKLAVKWAGGNSLAVTLSDNPDGITSSTAIATVTYDGVDYGLRTIASSNSSATGRYLRVAIASSGGALYEIRAYSPSAPSSSTTSGTFTATFPSSVGAVPQMAVTGTNWAGATTVEGGTVNFNTVSAAFNGTSIDNGAATATGALAHLHAVYADGVGKSLAVKIQHSSDNGVGDAWSDLFTFTTLTNIGAQRMRLANGTTVKRYVRAIVASGAITGTWAFSVALARYPGDV